MQRERQPIAIPTEPIGSIPRPLALIESIAAKGAMDQSLDPLYDEAIRDTIERFETTGSPVITDGEQRKYHNFWTYPVHGMSNTAPDGFKIPFAAGHTRRMPRLTGGPFRYQRRADSYLDGALRYAHVPVKQAVISPSALSLMYPPEEIPGYTREQFIDDLLLEHETEVRACLTKGAHKVQIDFTEGRLAVKIDPSGNLLSECDADVVVTASAAEALQEIGRQKPDVLVSDLGMPDQDGYELIKKVREMEAEQEAKATPALALTAYAKAEDRVRALAGGYQVHLSKPVEPAEFALVVANLIGRGTG